MKRPVLVTVVGVLLALGAAVQLLVAAVLFVGRDDATLVADTQLTSGELSRLALVLGVLALITLGVAVALLRGSRIARFLVGLVAVLHIMTGLYTLVVFDTAHRGAGLVSVVEGVLVLWFFYGTDKARAFFAKMPA